MHRFPEKNQDVPASVSAPASGSDTNQPYESNNNLTPSNTANGAEIIISVDQPTVQDEAIVPSTPYTLPSRNDSTARVGADNSQLTDILNSSRISTNGDASSILSGEESQRPTSPTFGGNPAPAFRYPGHSLRGDYTPSVRSGNLPGHQQSIRPYSSSIRNDYHPPLGGHRMMDGHSPSRDSGKPMVIDYAGLDASVAEASMIEESLQRAAFAAPLPTPSGMTPGGMGDKGDDREQKGLDRAASTGSSIVLGPSSAHSGASEFRRRSARKASFYSERAPRPPLPESLRYTFFSKATGLIQAPSMRQILSSATIQTADGGSRIPSVFSELLKDGCYWLDILDPSDFDMQVLAKHFHVHPLTIEDISTEEVREKYEVFRHYYFVCFRTFDQDYNSGSYLQPASMYSVVFRDGLITFHFRPTDHHMNVLRRMEQLHSHITLTPDWINYALLDDITDSFASPIQTIQYEVDSIDELVLLLRESETTDMLRRIGSCRKNVMSLSRLLANKADVVRGLMKRFDERYTIAPLASSSITAAVQTTNNPGAHPNPAPTGAAATVGGVTGANGANATTGATTAPTGKPDDNTGGLIHPNHHRDGEILLYLGDILDHVLTMLQSLWSYEKILDRSHSNYLAQISLEINQLSNKTNEVVGTLTFFASLIVPMTFVTGLWGMNVHVPGQPGVDPDVNLDWWWGLIGVLLVYCVIAIFFGKRYKLI
ncbi:CorA metal ion transporter [Mortierella claussenii]|nr:CorA metal ion transporter [Mortierella claussenii]